MSKNVNKEVSNEAIFKDKRYVKHDPKHRDMHPGMSPHVTAMRSGKTNRETNGGSYPKKVRRIGKLTMPSHVFKNGKVGNQKRDKASIIFEKGVVAKLLNLFMLINKGLPADAVEVASKADLKKFLKRKNLHGATLVKTALRENGVKYAEKSFTLGHKHFRQVAQRFV